MKDRQDNEQPHVVNALLIRASEITPPIDPIEPAVSIQDRPHQSILVYKLTINENRTCCEVPEEFCGQRKLLVPSFSALGRPLGQLGKSPSLVESLVSATLPLC